MGCCISKKNGVDGGVGFFSFFSSRDQYQSCINTKVRIDGCKCVGWSEGAGGGWGELKGRGLLFVYKIECGACNYLPTQCALGYASA